MTRKQKEKFDRIVRRDKPPYYYPLGLDIMEVGENYAKVKMTYSKDICNVYGMVNGGIIATLADAAVANALLGAYDDEILTSIGFSMSFWRATKTSVYAEALILHRGSHVAMAEVDVKDENGKAVSKALFTYAVNKKKGSNLTSSRKGGQDDL
jgi:uncharacterized protein (TIGR00369 family)